MYTEQWNRKLLTSVEVCVILVGLLDKNAHTKEADTPVSLVLVMSEHDARAAACTLRSPIDCVSLPW
jgi:hypothetical protein